MGTVPLLLLLKPIAGMITGPNFCTKLQTANATKRSGKEQECKSTELLNEVCVSTKNPQAHKQSPWEVGGRSS